MRSLVVCVLALTFVLSVLPAHAQWCANYQSGGSNCYFTSQAQCLATISGVGGSCSQSGSAAPTARERPAAARSDIRRVPSRSEQRQEARRKEALRRSQRPAPATPPAATVMPATAAAPAAATAAPSSKISRDFEAARKLVLGGQYQAGIAALQALGFDEHPDVATYIGFAHSKLGRADQARSWYDRALSANPNHLLTLSFSGMLHADHGNLRGAQGELEKLRRLCDSNCNEYKALEAVLAANRR